MHCKFPIFINGTIALHVSGSFYAHHQERYQPYNGFGTISCSSVTDCCQGQDGTSETVCVCVNTNVDENRSNFRKNPVLTRAQVDANVIYFTIIQCVPLATEPGISLIILPLMRILQRNLKLTYLIV